MAHFLKHIACPRCGSSDANAVYSDTSTYCFSCNKGSRSKITPLVASSLRPAAEEKVVRLPDDCTQEYNNESITWLNKYHVDVSLAIKHNLLYSKQRNQLIFPFYDSSKTLLAYQARNLSPISKGKRYFTSGDVNVLLPIYSCGVATRRCVLVEDCLSAIRVASVNGLGCDAMPLLGSGIGLSKIMRLRPFYDVLDVWLDSDMWHKAQNIARQAQSVGFDARALYSESDPKCYTDKELLDKLS